MVFTNKAVYDAFHKAVKKELGEQFYQSNSHAWSCPPGP